MPDVKLKSVFDASGDDPRYAALHASNSKSKGS